MLTSVLKNLVMPVRDNVLAIHESKERQVCEVVEEDES